MNRPPYHAGLPPKTDEARLPLALLQNFFEGVASEVRARGFCAVAVSLVAGHFEATGKAKTVPVVRSEAARYDLTAVLDRRRLQLVFRRLWRAGEGEAPDDWQRAAGAVFCEICGYEYREHPSDLTHEFLTVLCSGRRVKL